MPDSLLVRQQFRTWLERRGIHDVRVLEAMQQVPREEFVPPHLQHRAYDDCALPVSSGQTISQPYIVALMTQLLALQGSETVLEIGTGTGYQTAVLSRLAKDVVTIERLPALAHGARHVLERLGYHNVESHIGDGTLGWPARAPYDAIIVTAAAPAVPPPLYAQLRLGGCLVIPVGNEVLQSLQLVVHEANGPRVLNTGGCRFVQLIGAAGWPEEPRA